MSQNFNIGDEVRVLAGNYSGNIGKIKKFVENGEWNDYFVCGDFGLEWYTTNQLSLVDKPKTTPQLFKDRENGYKYTDHANSLDKQCHIALKPIVEMWVEMGYSPREIETVIQSAVATVCYEQLAKLRKGS